MITRGEFFMIKEMYERGMSISDIARELGTIGKPSENIFTPPISPSKSKRKPRKANHIFKNGC